MAAPMFSMAMFIRRNLHLNRLPNCRKRSGWRDRHQLLDPNISETTYESVVKSHVEKADRSILVGFSGNIGDIYQTCSKYGTVQAIYPFRTSMAKNYGLIQMASRSSVDGILYNSRQFENKDKVPMRTRFLHQPTNVEKRKQKRYPGNVVKNVQNDMDVKILSSNLLTCKSPDDQMLHLCEYMSQSESALRIRFFLCSALSETLRGIIPGCSITPFGSTVNGFGRNRGDLDMLLETDAYDEFAGLSRKDSFFFLTKKKQEDSRFQAQMTLETIGGIIANFVPQFGFVRRILKARVPIVRFTSSSTHIECDLSINNKSALYMSELLHLYSRLDHRVRPLVFTIRHWAAVNGVTQSKPGLYISNFMLTWMVIFFLQTRSTPLVPFITELENYAGPSDHRDLDGEDIAFVRDWSKIPRTSNTQSLDELLLEFFSFYASFDFEANAISMHRGPYAKPSTGGEGDSLYIENPIEKDMNAGKIVIESELNKFKEASSKAFHQLNNSLGMKPGRTPWGIMSLFMNNERTTSDKRINIHIGDIFSQTDVLTKDNSHGDSAEVTSPITGSFKDPVSAEDKPDDRNHEMWEGTVGKQGNEN